jgi:hypothetical protein
MKRSCTRTTPSVLCLTTERADTGTSSAAGQLADSGVDGAICVANTSEPQTLH